MFVYQRVETIVIDLKWHEYMNYNDLGPAFTR